MLSLKFSSAKKISKKSLPGDRENNLFIIFMTMDKKRFKK